MEFIDPRFMKADKRFDRVEAQNVGSHVSDHPSLVGEEPVLAVWFGARTFSLDAEGLEEICWLETVVWDLTAWGSPPGHASGVSAVDWPAIFNSELIGVEHWSSWLLMLMLLVS